MTTDPQTAVKLLREAQPHVPPCDTRKNIDEFLARMDEPVVRVHRDEYPQNPFADWDCEPPIIVAYAERRGMHLCSYGESDELPHLDRPTVLKHWREMLREMTYTATFGGLRELVRDQYRYYDGRVDRNIAGAFAEHYAESCASDKLKLLETVYGWLGIPCYFGVTTGYSQGDYAEVLAVATPEWQTKVGAPDDSLVEQCRNAVKLYGYWAWGDVWGYTIETRGGEHIDSCWGFYGDDLETTGMLAAADEKYHDALRAAWENIGQ